MGHGRGRKRASERERREKLTSRSHFHTGKAPCQAPIADGIIAAMDNPAELSPAELASFLRGCPGWEMSGSEICRAIKFKTFLAGIGFVQAVAEIAEDAGHHPDISIRYSTVTLSLTTHSKGCLTKADFEVAGLLDQLLAKEGVLSGQ